MDDLRLTWVLHFCKFLTKPSIDLELDCIFGKITKHRFQRHIVLTETLPIFHVWVEFISVPKYAIRSIQTNGWKSQNSSFSWGTWTRLIHPSHQPYSPPPTTARSVHALPHNYTTKSPMVTMGCPKFIPQTAFPLRWSPPPSDTHIHRVVYRVLVTGRLLKAIPSRQYVVVDRRHYKSVSTSIGSLGEHTCFFVLGLGLGLALRVVLVI